LLRGLPVLLEGWKFFAREAASVHARKSSVEAV
jgi:hypothetical protein